MKAPTRAPAELKRVLGFNCKAGKDDGKAGKDECTARRDDCKVEVRVPGSGFRGEREREKKRASERERERERARVCVKERWDTVWSPEAVASKSSPSENATSKMAFLCAIHE
jgi:hypothetical protein